MDSTGSQPAKLLYIDHSIVTREEKWPALKTLLASGHAKLVLSLWNFFEIACATDAAQRTKRIAFLEQLSPLWVRERRDIQGQELKSFLWRHRYQCPAPAVDATARYFSMLVSNWTKHNTVVGLTPGQWVARLDMPRLSKMKEKAPEALSDLQKHGAVAMKKKQTEIFGKWIEKLIPTQDPNGNYLSARDKADLLRYCIGHRVEVLGQCPALAVEDSLTFARTQNARRIPTNSDGPDLMHAVVALAYCDYFLVDDGYVRSCAESVYRKLPHAKLAAVHRGVAELLAAQN